MLEGLVRPYFDRWFVEPVAKNRWVRRPNIITLIAVFFGLLVVPALYVHLPWLAVVLLLLSGYCDVLDGVVAREQNLQSDLGSFFDILADRIVEAAVVVGLFLVDPASRGLSCLLVLSSILLCITAFLLLGVFVDDSDAGKSFYYSPGLIERSEAFVFFGLMMLLPHYFFQLSCLFVGLVLLTVLQHVRAFVSSVAC